MAFKTARSIEEYVDRGWVKRKIIVSTHDWAIGKIVPVKKLY